MTMWLLVGDRVEHIDPRYISGHGTVTDIKRQVVVTWDDGMITRHESSRACEVLIMLSMSRPSITEGQE